MAVLLAFSEAEVSVATTNFRRVPREPTAPAALVDQLNRPDEGIVRFGSEVVGALEGVGDWPGETAGDTELMLGFVDGVSAGLGLGEGVRTGMDTDIVGRPTRTTGAERVTVIATISASAPITDSNNATLAHGKPRNHFTGSP